MVYREGLEYCPGLLKVVDEILVNAVDHAVRTRLTNRAWRPSSAST